MADPFSDITQDDTFFLGEISQVDMVIGKLSGRTGCRMIDENDGSPGVVNSIQVCLTELSQCQGSGAILDKYEVYRGNNNIAGTGIYTGFGT